MTRALRLLRLHWATLVYNALVRDEKRVTADDACAARGDLELAAQRLRRRIHYAPDGWARVSRL